MSNQAQNPKIYDLAERTSTFGENVIKFSQSLPQSAVNTPLVIQFVKSGTSIGANYMEADAAESKRDFDHKIGICKKEAKESMYWSRMIATAHPDRKEECRKFWIEAHELLLIFSSIIKKNKKE